MHSDLPLHLVSHPNVESISDLPLASGRDLLHALGTHFLSPESHFLKPQVIPPMFPPPWSHLSTSIHVTASYIPDSTEELFYHELHLFSFGFIFSNISPQKYLLPYSHFTPLSYPKYYFQVCIIKQGGAWFYKYLWSSTKCYGRQIAD